MEQVLYTKYNSLRRPEYRVVTEIRQMDGEKYVVKRAECPEAGPQVAKILWNGELLKGYYREIRILPAERLKNGARFSFVRGISLKEKILREPYEKERFIRLVNECLNRTLDVQETYRCTFKRTEDFDRWFGKADPGAVPAICPANIDTLPDNFVENEEGLTCLDYEWVCEFPVPVGYIRYRVLLYLYGDLARSLLDGVEKETFMAWFGLTEEEAGTYEAMENAFQQQVHGEGWKYRYTERYRKAMPALTDILRTNKWQEQAIEDKDRHIGDLGKIIQDKETHISTQEKIIRDKDTYISGQERIIRDQRGLIDSKDQAIREKEEYITGQAGLIHNQEELIRQLELNYQAITNAFFWRITKPARMLSAGFKKLTIRNERFSVFCSSAKAGLFHGPARGKETWDQYWRVKREMQYPADWPKEELLKKQEKEKFDRDITFSILVPLYNTPEDFLFQMIDSVKNQTYGKWELCLADGSDQEHRYVKKICKRAARKDGRIKYRKLTENKGISGNTNACLEMATGEYTALFDHDDILYPTVLYECMKAICEQGADYIYTDEATFESPDLRKIITYHFKPDFSPDNLLANNYICHFSAFRTELIRKVGGFRSKYDGSQDHDLILRLTHVAKKIVHIPQILYLWRSHPLSVAQDIGAKEYAINAAKNAVKDFIRDTQGIETEVLSTRAFPTIFQIRYPIREESLISIIIPNRDHRGDLKRCLESILEKTTYQNYEVLIVENNSIEKETFEYYRELEQNSRIRVIRYEGAFNYARINNQAVKEAKGEYVLLLNNDTEIITPEWMENMLMYAQRADVAAVGAKLFFPNGSIQHAGIILKLGQHRIAGHSHYLVDHDNLGYMGRLCYTQDVSAVTAACLLVKKSLYEAVGGMEEAFAVAFNDVDFCLKLRKAGYLNIFTPFAELYHYESASRGTETGEKQQRFEQECKMFRERWKEELDQGDPYYNPNFSLDTSTFDPVLSG